MSATPAFQTPSIRRRLAALLYELVLLFAVLALAALPVTIAFGGLTEGWRRWAFQAYLVAVLGAYFVFNWTRSGQTLAMKTWRIKVVTSTGASVTVPRAAARFLAALALAAPALTALLVFSRYRTHFWALSWTVLPLLAAWLWARFDAEGQFLHDRLAGTRLIQIAKASN